MPFDVQDSQRNYNWRIEINGFEQGMAQEVDMPALTVQTLMAGASGTAPDAKLPGKASVDGLLVLKKLKARSVVGALADRTFHNALELAIANRRSAVFRAFVHLTDENGSIVESYDGGNCFVQKVQVDPLRRKSDEGELLMETVEIQTTNWSRVI